MNSTVMRSSEPAQYVHKWVAATLHARKGLAALYIRQGSNIAPTAIAVVAFSVTGAFRLHKHPGPDPCANEGIMCSNP